MGRRGQLLDVHLDRGFAGDVDHQRVRIAAAGRRSRPAGHSPSCRRPPEVSQRFGSSKWKCWAAHIWCWPTSVVMIGALSWSLPRGADRALGHDDPGIAFLEVEAARARQPLDAAPPFEQVGTGMLAKVPRIEHRPSAGPTSATMGRSTRTFLLILERSMSTWIFALFGEKASEPTGHTVVEAGAQGDDQVGLVHRQIGFIGAVHPQHAQPLVGRGREGAEAHQRRCNRRARHIGELAQQARSPPGPG